MTTINVTTINVTIINVTTINVTTINVTTIYYHHWEQIHSIIFVVKFLHLQCISHICELFHNTNK